MTDEDSKESGQVARTVLVHYRKSNFCRVIYASGVWGGSTPEGKIRMAIFSEKVAVPRSAAFGLDQGGRVLTIQETPTPQEQEIEREIEVEIMLDPQVALSVRNWLDRNLQGKVAKTQDSEEFSTH